MRIQYTVKYIIFVQTGKGNASDERKRTVHISNMLCIPRSAKQRQDQFDVSVSTEGEII